MRRLSQMLAISQLLVLSLHAMPESLQVIAGDAKLSMQGNTCTIKSGKEAIIHWGQFSIGKSEVVNFMQADSHSAILNRVTGGMESQILGSIYSNGQVFLVNPSGVFIGSDARIESAGFTASVSDVMDETFLKREDLVFFGAGPGSIVNLGTIHCPTGSIVLIGRTVRNEGRLEAPQGHTDLVSGSEVLLQLEGRERVFIAPDLDPQDGMVEHTGTISSLTAELKSGGSPYAKAVKVSGTIEALSVREENGRIYLVAENGLTEVHGSLKAAGGEIKVLGKEVHLLDGASIDVSGDLGGGEIYVGGSFQGKDRSFLHAEKTIVAPETSLYADSLEMGDGGTIIVWGDEATVFFGKASAQGGPLGGDGGFVEVSSPGYYQFHGDVKTLASQGKVGTLLLDPPDITISNLADTNVTFAGMAYTTTAAGNGNVNIPNLLTNLMGSNVTVNSTPGSGGNGDIILNNTLTIPLGTNNTLTLSAFRHVALNFAITNNSILAPLTLTAGTGGPGSIIMTGAPITQGPPGGTAGPLTMTAATDINANFGSGITSHSTATTSLTTNTGDILLGGGIFGTQNGTIILDSNGRIFMPSTNNSFVGPNFVALNFTARGNNPGMSIAGILIQGSINTVDGDVILNATSGGNMGDNNYGFHATGTFINSTGSGNISITSRGGPGVNTNYGFVMTGGPVQGIQSTGTGTITLRGTGGGDGTGIDNIGLFLADSGGSTFFTSTSGTITLIGTGGVGTSNSMGISVPSADVSTTSGNIFMTGTGGTMGVNNIGVNIASNISTMGAGNITVTGSSGMGPAVLFDTGASVTPMGTGSLALNTGLGDLNIVNGAAVGTVGGSIINSPGMMIAGDLNILGTTGAPIVSSGDDVTLRIGGDLNMQGLAGGNVQMNTLNNMTLNITGGLFLDATLMQAAIQTAAGDVNITTGGNIQMIGGLIDAVANATVIAGGSVLLDATASITNTRIQTIAGNLSVTAGSSLQLLSGSQQAVIQAGGGGTFIQLIAGTDIILASPGGIAPALITHVGAGDISLVVDNLFPSAPGHGTGSFQLDPGVTDMGSTITTTGMLKIYTSDRSLNIINPLDTINGAPFPPVSGLQPIGTDGVYEKWGIYFPAGTYGGAEYTFYYKQPFPPEPTPSGSGTSFSPILAINEAVIANSQLNQLLPFYYPNHTADFIDEEGQSSSHYFPRFEAFIFSNEVE